MSCSSLASSVALSMSLRERGLLWNIVPKLFAETVRIVVDVDPVCQR